MSHRCLVRNVHDNKRMGCVTAATFLHSRNEAARVLAIRKHMKRPVAAVLNVLPALTQKEASAEAVTIFVSGYAIITSLSPLEAQCG